MAWIVWGQWACERCWAPNPPEASICRNCGYGKN